MRILIAAALAAVPLLAPATASAACDPDYRPLCVSDCGGPMLPDPKDPLAWLIRTCPD